MYQSPHARLIWPLLLHRERQAHMEQGLVAFPWCVWCCVSVALLSACGGGPGCFVAAASALVCLVPPGPLWAVSGLPFVGVVLALLWFWTPPPALVGLLLPAPCGSAPPGPALPAPVPACGGPWPGLGFCPGCALVSSVPSPLAGGSSCRGACVTLSLSLSPFFFPGGLWRSAVLRRF